MKKMLSALFLLGFALLARAEVVGDVSTAFQLMGPDHKIVVEVFDDPKVKGLTSSPA